MALLFGQKNLNAEEDQNGQPVQSGIFSYWPSYWRTKPGQNDQKGKTIFFLDLFSQSFLSQKC